MILSLAVISILFCVAIAVIGVNPLGDLVITGSPTATAMNATVWNTYSSIGDLLWVVFALIIALALTGLIYYSFKTLTLEQKGD